MLYLHGCKNECVANLYSLSIVEIMSVCIGFPFEISSWAVFYHGTCTCRIPPGIILSSWTLVRWNGEWFSIFIYIVGSYWYILLFNCFSLFHFHFHLLNSFLPEANFGLRVLSLPASVCVSVRLCVNHELVRAITHHPFQLGSPNLDQRCKRPWWRSLLFCGTIDCDLQGQIELQSQNLPHFELVHAITHHQLELQFPNLEQKCILALFRSLPILGLIEIDLQFNFQFQTQTKLSFLCTSLAFFSETS